MPARGSSHYLESIHVMLRRATTVWIVSIWRQTMLVATLRSAKALGRINPAVEQATMLRSRRTAGMELQRLWNSFPASIYFLTKRELMLSYTTCAPSFISEISGPRFPVFPGTIMALKRQIYSLNQHLSRDRFYHLDQVI